MDPKHDLEAANVWLQPWIRTAKFWLLLQLGRCQGWQKSEGWTLSGLAEVRELDTVRVGRSQRVSSSQSLAARVWRSKLSIASFRLTWRCTDLYHIGSLSIRGHAAAKREVAEVDQPHEWIGHVGDGEDSPAASLRWQDGTITATGLAQPLLLTYCTSTFYKTCQPQLDTVDSLYYLNCWIASATRSASLCDMVGDSFICYRTGQDFGIVAL